MDSWCLYLTPEHLPDKGWSTEIGRLWNCTSAKQVLQAACGPLQVVDFVLMGKCFCTYKLPTKYCMPLTFTPCSTVELARTCIGTPYYLSPEICENRPYNNKR